MCLCVHILYVPCVYIYIHIHVYIDRERDIEREIRRKRTFLNPICRGLYFTITPTPWRNHSESRHSCNIPGLMYL